MMDGLSGLASRGSGYIASCNIWYHELCILYCEATESSAQTHKTDLIRTET